MSETDTKRPARPWGALVGACAIAALLVVWAMQGSLSGAGVPVGRAATIAVGMTLQAIPFLLLGVFVAELIEACFVRASPCRRRRRSCWPRPRSIRW